MLISLPSSRMTLSPKTVISNLPVASSLERMLRMGRERALRSMAATPMHRKFFVSFPCSRASLCGYTGRCKAPP